MIMPARKEALTTDSNQIPRYVWQISAVVIIGSIMSILDTTIVNVALATLARDLHSSISQIQWVVTGYMLALAAVIPVSGWAARRFGAKRVYIVSLVLFTVGSALCGQAHSTTELVIFRVLQGLGGGMIMPVGQLMMAEAAGPKRMGRVMSLVAVPMMLAPIFGPTIGGLILENMSWRWIFYVNIPVGLIGVIMGLRILPKAQPVPTDRLDFLGFGLLAVGLPLVTYGLAEIGTLGTFASSRVIVPVAIGLVLIAVFIPHALRARRPLLNLRLYKRRTFSTASFTMFCLGAALFGSMILLPLYWQTVRHESVIITGLLSSPQGLGMALVMPLVGKLTDRYGGGMLTVIGVALTTLATVPFGMIGAHTSITYLCGAMFLRGIGMGFAFMPAMTAAFASLQRSELSDATPQLTVLQRIGGSIGTAVLAVVLQRSTAGSHTLAGAAHGYGISFWWSAGMMALAVVPSIMLLVAERNARRLQAIESSTKIDSGTLAEALV
jgi:EmrB/QacA subfamily drug resistance transporter